MDFYSVRENVSVRLTFLRRFRSESLCRPSFGWFSVWLNIPDTRIKESPLSKAGGKWIYYTAIFSTDNTQNNGIGEKIYYETHYDLIKLHKILFITLWQKAHLFLLSC